MTAGRMGHQQVLLRSPGHSCVLPRPWRWPSAPPLAAIWLVVIHTIKIHSWSPTLVSRSHTPHCPRYHPQAGIASHAGAAHTCPGPRPSCAQAHSLVRGAQCQTPDALALSSLETMVPRARTASPDASAKPAETPPRRAPLASPPPGAFPNAEPSSARNRRASRRPMTYGNARERRRSHS